MADKIKVAPNPIQRNDADVAIELTKMYIDTLSVSEISIELIQTTYVKMHAAACGAKIITNGYETNDNISSLMPEIFE